jgi:Holliday junction resolvase RusA-like endonuclease
MPQLSCNIGAPFSANGMYVPVGLGQMVKSKKYRKWLDLVVPQFKEQLRPAERFPIRIEILIVGGREWTEYNDIDNTCKPICDALVLAGIIPDDRSKFVESVFPRILPGSRRGETVTRISYEEPEVETSSWGEVD